MPIWYATTTGWGEACCHADMQFIVMQRLTRNKLVVFAPSGWGSDNAASMLLTQRQHALKVQER